ncbi:PQQ-dependent sugar dehydrogenase [Xanthocytophaga agilis]|uniref:PQQ-dependent sugar dehydrogenase n=1 Tax=Xanthocytophaga agilis TaxID=3048010 RepID=A0AAE3QXJ4_9BACT|nr:PQQ-dependent sugar dehydrogenase [Xanthocytophaga agilis]MDJ1499919.1 PQQ-dependent sugar dehydrogenase [Xanthocytophaga agilis]
MKKTMFRACALVLAVSVFSGFRDNGKNDGLPGKEKLVMQKETGLKIPAGFDATIVAENLGTARHLVVTPKGKVYVKLAKLKDGKGIAMLEDTNGDGKVDQQKFFGDFVGTGIAIKGNYLYASSNEEVFRYTLNANGEVTNPDKPEKIVTGLINRHQHESKSIVLDNNGNLYVNIGAYSNACQEKDRTKGSKGMTPCPILDSAGGIWQFKASVLNQTYGNGVRYATGLRNVVGLDWNTASNELFVMQHGRDQLFQLYPDMYDAKKSAELPAETMYAVKKGDDCGWPYVYYDQFQKKKILAPEYGGDGKKVGGEKALDPVVAFPGHMAPNGLLFYTGTMFPAKYKNGAFIAFHGSWNRAPEKQKGYFVAFVPFKNGKPSGEWEIFADSFAGTEDLQSPGQAQHRPCGLAQGPDGALYVSDDVKGTIYKITYKGK